MGVPEGVRVEHGAGLGRHEQVGTVGVLCVLLYQQLHRPLRDGQSADGVRRLGLADHQFAVDAVHLLADRDGHVLHVQVRPQQGEELAPAQAGGQLQIECRQQSAPFRFGQIRADLVLRQYLHLPLFQLWQAAALSGVGEEQPLRHRLLQAVVQQRVDAPYHAGAEALILQLDVGISLDAAGFLQVVVELLDLDGGQLFQRRVAQLGNDVVVNVVEVVVLGFLPKARLGVDLIPQLDPRAQCVGLGSAHVQLFSLRNGLLELFLGFGLVFGEDAFVDGLAGGRIIACGVASLPAAVFPLAQTPLTVCTFLLCHTQCTLRLSSCCRIAAPGLHSGPPAARLPLLFARFIRHRRRSQTSPSPFARFFGMVSTPFPGSQHTYHKPTLIATEGGQS